MENFITKDSLELWKENISYIIYHSPKTDPDNIAESILDYLKGEGAFEVINDEAPLPETEPKRFKAGQSYDFTDWFTGGMSLRTVKKVTDRKAVFEVSRLEIDGEFKAEETSDILFDKDHNAEYIVVYEYKGEEARIYAES